VRWSRVPALALLGLFRGLLEAAVVVQLIALAFAAAGRPAEGLPAALGTRSASSLIASIAATTVAAVAVHMLSERLIAAVTAETMLTARTELLAAYCRADPAVLAGERAGTLPELFSTAASVAGQGTLTLSAALVGVAHLVVVTGVAVLLSPAAAIGALLIAGLAVLAGRWPRARAAALARANSASNRVLATAVAETTHLARDLRLHGVAAAHVAGLDGPIRENGRLFAELRRHSRVVPACVRHGSIVGVAAYLGTLGQLSTLAVGSLGATVLLIVRAIGYGQQVSAAIGSLADRETHLKRLGDALDRYRPSTPAGVRPATPVGVVEVSDLWFRHPAADLPVLRGVTMTVRPGEAVGIVGASGAGKSTLLHLLLGLLRPDAGRITAGGVDVADLDPDDWHRRVALVAQDPRLLSATVRDNIRFLRPEIDDEAIVRAAVAASLSDDLSGWPEGLDHPVGPLGGGLSAGQRQRVALARALAGSPEVLVLDEPTSTLDPANETAVVETIRRLRGRVAVVVVAHRTSTVDACDRVLALRDGVIRARDPSLVGERAAAGPGGGPP
jgi:ATP-binding cassette, subfamily B, bacterial